MKRYIRNISLVCIPTLLALGWVMVIFFDHSLNLLYTGKEPKGPYLLSEPYNDEYIAHLKFQKDLTAYGTLALGSSRVLMLSQDMFPGSFYNLGYTTSNIYQINALLEKMDIRGKTLIIGLDQWAFNPHWPDMSRAELPSTDITGLHSFLSRAKLLDILKGRVHPVTAIPESRGITLIGSGANLALSGIRNDGSFYYGKTYAGLLSGDADLTGPDHDFQDTRNRISKATLRFEHGTTADTGALRQVEILVRTCRERGNRITLFLPPFPPTIIRKLDNPDYGYIKDLRGKLEALSKRLDVPFFDFTQYPSTDGDYIDGFHAGKKLYYAMLKDMGIPVKPLTFPNPFESDADSAMTRLREACFRIQDSKQ